MRRRRRTRPRTKFKWTGADAYFNFTVQMRWRANKPILAAQIEKRWTDEELGLPGGIIRTKGHQYWFLEHPKWLISPWARVQVTEDCKIQYRMLQTFWERQKEMVLTQLGVWMLTLPPAEPHDDYVHAAVQ